MMAENEAGHRRRAGSRTSAANRSRRGSPTSPRTAGEARDAAKNVGKWMRRKYRLLEMSQLPGRGWVEYEPYGTVLIIGAWNFPFALTLGPAVGAIAAGNTVVLKPSEVAPASSALMAELVPQYLDNDAIAVIEGDGAVSQELIAQGFDRLLFTGGTEIGRKVYEGAAAHLTPVTLELGGKSPVIVAADADIDVAAKRIAWTKLINSGQICIAPDYVLADATVRDELVGKIKDAVTAFEADDPAGKRIVNQRHFDRLTAALAATKGNHRDRRRFGRGVAEDPADRRRRSRSGRAADDRRDLRARSCRWSRSKTSTRQSNSSTRGPSRWRPTCSPRPRAIRERVIKEVPAGGMVVNHLMFHFATTKLPFGGVGPSGMGAYHGKFGLRGVQPPQVGADQADPTRLDGRDLPAVYREGVEAGAQAVLARSALTHQREEHQCPECRIASSSSPEPAADWAASTR